VRDEARLTHLEPEVLAAWMEGTLSAADRRIAEGHAAGCDRCQAMLAAMVRAEPPSARPAPWWSAGAIRWAVPLVASAAALALWFAVAPGTVLAPAAPPVAPVAPVETSTPQPTAPAPPALAKDKTARIAGSAREEATPSKSEDRRADTSAQAAAPAVLDKKVDALKPESTVRNQAAAAASPALRDTVAVGAPASEAIPREIVSPAGPTRWRIVSAGRVDRSIDGGATWAPTDLPGGAQVTAGASPAAGICWLVGRDGLVLRTLDGSTWTRLQFPESLALTAVETSSADAALVRSENSRSFATSDGGRTWVRR
jgi:hypothetical protein